MTRTFLLLILFSFAMNLSAHLQLELRSEAKVFSPEVRLGDLVNWEQKVELPLKNLLIGWCDPQSKQTVFSRAEILEKLINNGVKDVELVGQKAVRVIFSGVKVDGTKVYQLIEDYIRKYSPWKDDCKLKVALPREFYIPPEATLSVEPFPGQDFLATMQFRLLASYQNEKLSSEWFTVRLSVEREVALSACFLPAGKVLEAEDIRFEKREITPYLRQAFFRPEDLIGRKLARAVSAQRVLTANLLERNLAVKRGYPATLIFNGSQLRISTTVRVLEDGALGEQVRVQNLVSKQIFLAKVTGKNLVEVIE